MCLMKKQINMNIVKIIFFHIYNSYYNDGSYRNDVPHWTAFAITACSLACLIVTFVCVIVNLVTGGRPTALLLYPIFLVLLIYFFYNILFKKKYQIIYTQLIGGRWDTKIMRCFSWIIILIGFISVGLYAYIFNQK